MNSEADSEDAKTPFQRLEDLTAKLFAVPKKEYERLEAEWRKGRQAKRNGRKRAKSPKAKPH